MFDGFLSEVITGAKDFFTAKEATKQAQANAEIAERASINALTLRSEQIRALALAAAAGVAIVLLLRQRRRG